MSRVRVLWPAFLPALLACGPSAPGPDDAGAGTEDETVVGTAPPCALAVTDGWATEGDLVEIPVVCDGDAAVSVEGLPQGATFADGVLRWTPGLGQAGRYDLRARAVARDGRGAVGAAFTVHVADAWDAPDNVPVDPLGYTEEFGLPVLHLAVPTDANDDDTVPTTVTWRGARSVAGVKFRGASAADDPKRSYTLEFRREAPFDAPGWSDRREIVLTSTFDDASYVRQLLCFELWSALDPDGEPLQAMPVVLYTNGDYHGVYLLSDHIDGEWWEDAGFDEDGPLYKAVDPRANFRATYAGAPKDTWHDGYARRGATEDWAPLDALVEWAATSDDATFAGELAQRWAEDELMRWWVLVRWVEADGSGGDNAYLYRDPLEGRWHHAPWDFTHSLGQTSTTERQAADTDHDFYESNHLFERALEHPDLGPRWRASMRAAMDGPLASGEVTDRARGWIDTVRPAALRDWEKWGAAHREAYGWRTDLQEPEQEWSALLAWIEARAAFMETRFP
jgi:spore coat protein H